MTRARWLTPLLAVIAVGTIAWWTDRGGPGNELDIEPVDRVLIVSLPGVDWQDLDETNLANLNGFVGSAAIADMSTKVGRHAAGTTDAYLTLGSGTRSLAPSSDVAVAVDPDESYGGVATTEILERRLGYVPTGIAYLASGAARDVNQDSEFGAEVGLLGEMLEEQAVDRAVIANADAVEGLVTEERPPEGYYARSAVTALMGSDGIVPAGRVGRSLLLNDPDAAFGIRLDPDAVLLTFDDTWTQPGRSVVLVEASDLSRAATYGPQATTEQLHALRAEALADADALLGRLLERVDPDRDAVIVLSPVASTGSPALGIAALQAPGVEPGLLQSATTRRDGYVQLADVAPTVLSLLGHEAPTDIEGRTFQAGDRPSGDRVEQLTTAARSAELRDFLLPVVITAVGLIIMALGVATFWRDRLPAPLRRSLAPMTYWSVGVIPAAFLPARVDAAQTSALVHVAVIAAGAAVVAAVAVLADRYRPGLGPIFAVGSIVAVIGIDVLLGGSLQLNTVFGYAVTVAFRFAGIGNLAFALFGAAAILLAALLVDRYGRSAMGVALAVLLAAVLIDGLPMLGANVGSLVSMIPAFGVTWLLLVGRRIGRREVLSLATATVAAVLVFAFMDAMRPAQTQTHLARLADQVTSGNWELFFKNLGRRWQASFGSLELAGWLTIAIILAIAVTYAVLVARRRTGSTAWAWSGHRPTTAAAAGLATLATIGLVANDSSFTVPAIMLMVVVPVALLRALRSDKAPTVGWQL
jgi:hypothetical protein